MEPKRILLAENEPETARFIESELQNLGLTVDTLADGNEAWNLLQAGKYAILISDENQQKLGFRDLAKKIRSEPNLTDLPIFFVVDKIPVLDIIGPPYRDSDKTFERHNLSDIGKWVQRVLTSTDTSDERYLL